MLTTTQTGDQVFIGIMGGEAQSPRFSMAHAVKLVPYRVTFIYMMAVIFITLLVPSDDERLLGGGGVTASPFVISVIDAGIPVLPDIMNAAMIFSILAIGAESVYLSSRILREMAHKKLIPEYFATVDSQGRPRWALAITCGLGIFLSYLSLSCKSLLAFRHPVATNEQQLVVTNCLSGSSMSRARCSSSTSSSFVSIFGVCFTRSNLTIFSLYELSLPSITSCAGRPAIQPDLRVEISRLAHYASLAVHVCSFAAGLLHRSVCQAYWCLCHCILILSLQCWAPDHHLNHSAL